MFKLTKVTAWTPYFSDKNGGLLLLFGSGHCRTFDVSNSNERFSISRKTGISQFDPLKALNSIL